MDFQVQTLFILLLLVVKAISQDDTTLLRIDCGANSDPWQTDSSSWQTDDNYISTGANRQVASASPLIVSQLNTLRVFTKQNKNCYTLPIARTATYFIRAAFYYGNYDGLRKPPTFDLEFDGNKWATVETTMPPYFQYYEVVYKTQRHNVSVCLARTQQGEFPFISTLEVWPLADNMYDFMDRSSAWFKSYRYNYGVDPSFSNWIIGYDDGDEYNRIWESDMLSGTVNQETYYLLNTTVDFPPDTVIQHMAESQDLEYPINLTFSIPRSTNSNIFISIYFTEARILGEGEVRLIDLYVNNGYGVTVAPPYEACSGMYITVTAPSDTLSVQLRANQTSTLPPVVSAIEVYMASDPLIDAWTLQDDLGGLQVLIDAFEQLNGWSGDPCLPIDTVWQWLGCTSNNPPRVTKIDLSAYGLNGFLPDFSKMQSLENIYLGNNSLSGPIPSFLGTLPNLTVLDLSNNNFSGKVPPSITQNPKLTYNIDGNPHLQRSKKKNLALITGLSVGLPVGLLLVIVIIYFLARRKRPTPVQGQVMLNDLSRPQNATAQATKPPESSPTAQPTHNNGDTVSSISLQESISSDHHPSSVANRPITHADVGGPALTVPDFNRAELDELLDLHNMERRG